MTDYYLRLQNNRELLKTCTFEQCERRIRVTQSRRIRLTTTCPRRIVMAGQMLHFSHLVHVKTT